MVSPHSTSALLSTIASVFFVSVNAHMIMKTPEPYGNSTLNNSPLAADGSDFPCKQRTGVYDVESASNVMAVGSNQTLSFIGSAVHGGGSCQVSLTTDLQPTKSSKWMVIHSIEGGCPADVSGNLTPNAEGDDPYTFSYTIPEGVNPGNYTIAWSWVNKIGNREYYMNCGPATITGGTSSKRGAPLLEQRATTFPDLFVANLAGVSDGCTTTEGIDIKYPDPGSSVDIGANANLGPPVGCSGSSAAANSSSSSGSSSSSDGTSSAVVAASSATDAASAATSSASGGFATGAASSASSASSPAATATAITSGSAETSVAVSPVPESSAAAATSSSATVSASGSASTSSTTTGSQSGACSDEGAYACSSDGSSFQRCASGSWSAAIPMAAGTKCTPGTSDNLNMSATRRFKRYQGHPAHVRRSHHAWGLI